MLFRVPRFVKMESLLLELQIYYILERLGGKPYKLPIDEGQVRFAAEDAHKDRSVKVQH